MVRLSCCMSDRARKIVCLVYITEPVARHFNQSLGVIGTVSFSFSHFLLYCSNFSPNHGITVNMKILTVVTFATAALGLGIPLPLQQEKRAYPVHPTGYWHSSAPSVPTGYVKRKYPAYGTGYWNTSTPTVPTGYVKRGYPAYGTGYWNTSTVASASAPSGTGYSAP